MEPTEEKATDAPVCGLPDVDRMSDNATCFIVEQRFSVFCLNH